MELLSIFWTFFKIGLFTFGGGYAMIPYINDYAVKKNKWISSNEFLDIIAISETTPGPIAINAATYIGFKVKGVLGSIFATMGVVLPSLIIILTISIFFYQYKDNTHIEYAFQGIRIAVAVLILNAGLRMLKKINITILSILLILFGFFFILFKLLSVIYIIMIAGAIGLIYIILIKEEVGEDNA